MTGLTSTSISSVRLSAPTTQCSTPASIVSTSNEFNFLLLNKRKFPDRGLLSCDRGLARTSLPDLRSLGRWRFFQAACICFLRVPGEVTGLEGRDLAEMIGEVGGETEV